MTDPTQFGPLPGVFSQGFNMPPPDPSQAGGMFAGGGKFGIANAISSGLSGFMAGMYPQYASSFIAPMMQREQLNRSAQLAMLQSNLEFNRQMQMAQFSAQWKLQHPDDEFSTLERARGQTPGMPGYQSDAQAALSSKYTNPVVNAGQYGPVVYSQVAGLAGAKTLSDSDIAAADANPPTQPPVQGGPAPGAPGGFLGSGGYRPIGPY